MITPSPTLEAATAATLEFSPLQCQVCTAFWSMHVLIVQMMANKQGLASWLEILPKDTRGQRVQDGQQVTAGIMVGDIVKGYVWSKGESWSTGHTVARVNAGQKVWLKTFSDGKYTVWLKTYSDCEYTLWLQTFSDREYTFLLKPSVIVNTQYG